MIIFRIRELAERKKGLKSAYQFQMAMNLPPNTAHRWWKGELRAIDVNSLERLCDFFECEPGDLIQLQRGRAAKKSARAKSK